MLGETLDNARISDLIEDEAIILAANGAIHLDSFEDNDFTPVKACLTAALRKIADSYMPLNVEGKAIVNNLSKF